MRNAFERYTRKPTRAERRGNTGESNRPPERPAGPPAREESQARNGGPDRSPRPALTHIDREGEVAMVDVSEKPETERRAAARGRVRMSRETVNLISAGNIGKGNVLTTARLAGIMAAKRCAELIPLAHPLLLTHIDVDVQLGPDSVEIEASAETNWKTGVEMEALTAVTVAALTIYDMCKAVDRDMVIEAVRVVQKSGGRTRIESDPSETSGRRSFAPRREPPSSRESPRDRDSSRDREFPRDREPTRERESTRGREPSRERESPRDREPSRSRESFPSRESAPRRNVSSNREQSSSRDSSSGRTSSRPRRPSGPRGPGRRK